SSILNEASSTATTSRPSAKKVLRIFSISMRQRDVTSGKHLLRGRILGVRRFQEAVGDGVLELDRLLDAGELAVPYFLAARIGVRRNQAVPVGDVLELADLEQIGIARGRADEALDGAEDGLGVIGLDPLHGPPDRIGEGLRLLRLLLDGGGEAEIDV